MEHVMNEKSVLQTSAALSEQTSSIENLSQAEIDTTYIIRDVQSEDEDLKNFLFTLGCYKGEAVTVISQLAENYVINIKDARYSIDQELAEAIKV